MWLMENILINVNQYPYLNYCETLLLVIVEVKDFEWFENVGLGFNLVVLFCQECRLALSLNFISKVAFVKKNTRHSPPMFPLHRIASDKIYLASLGAARGI